MCSLAPTKQTPERKGLKSRVCVREREYKYLVFIYNKSLKIIVIIVNTPKQSAIVRMA